jgi:hypothetical protein
MRLLRMPIDFCYEILATTWIDAITATEVASLTYWLIGVTMCIVGMFIYGDFDNTATETYMN